MQDVRSTDAPFAVRLKRRGTQRGVGGKRPFIEVLKDGLIQPGGEPLTSPTPSQSLLHLYHLGRCLEMLHKVCYAQDILLLPSP